jgi:hypothetical protein
MPDRQKQGNFKTNRNTMTPKEKAEELVDKFRITLMNEDTDCGNEILCTSIAIQQSIIAVDEILNNFGLRTNGQNFYTEYKAVEYYQEVKQEIEKL